MDTSSYYSTSMVRQSIQQILQEESGVSTVVAVVLMLAVTIAIAAVIAGFVFGIGEGLNQPPPDAAIGFDYDPDTDQVEIYHDGGEVITSSNTGALSVTGGDYDGVWGEGYEPTGDGQEAIKEDGEPTTVLQTIWESNENEMASGDVIALQWQSPNGENSETLGSFDVP